eukprot:GHVQ01016821.1.p1 GENE.GHVQ01016821.1~~GHVQ01016821.1.p1  ORF type:complete len:165 (+),score=39.67 GHVQ01016821.1:631-1125(+)
MELLWKKKAQIERPSVRLCNDYNKPSLSYFHHRFSRITLPSLILLLIFILYAPSSLLLVAPCQGLSTELSVETARESESESDTDDTEDASSKEEGVGGEEEEGGEEEADGEGPIAGAALRDLSKKRTSISSFDKTTVFKRPSKTSKTAVSTDYYCGCMLSWCCY